MINSLLDQIIVTKSINALVFSSQNSVVTGNGRVREMKNGQGSQGNPEDS